MQLDGIAGSLEATKQGMLHHTVLSDSGSEETLEITAVFMTGLETRLISPQLHQCQLESSGKGTGKYVIHAGSSFLHLPNKHVITLGYDSLTNLPMLTCFWNLDDTAAGLAMTCLSNEMNQNPTFLQIVLLQWHFCTGHLGFQRLQWCGREGQPGLGFGHSSVSAPKCASFNMVISNANCLLDPPRRLIWSTRVYSSMINCNLVISFSVINMRVAPLDTSLVFKVLTSPPKNTVVDPSLPTPPLVKSASNTSLISLWVNPFMPRKPLSMMQ
jgi:hypothetical protein